MNWQKVPAKHFVQMLAKNVNNEKLDDAAFREFVRNSLEIVEGGDNAKYTKTSTSKAGITTYTRVDKDSPKTDK